VGTLSNSDNNRREHVGRFVTIYKRGGVYHAQINANGLQRRRSLHTHKLREARARALDLDARVQSGDVWRRTPRVTLQRAIEHYIDYVKGAGRRRKTVTQYSSDLDAFLGFATEKRIHFLDQIDLLTAEEYRADLRKAGYADKTLQHRLVILKQLVKWAVERALLPHDPLAGLRVRQAQARPQPCFTLEQVEKMIAAAAGTLKQMVEVLAFSGMRISELVWLEWADVDFERGFVHVRPKEGWAPKNGRPRVFPMHARVRAVLEALPRGYRWVFTARASAKYPLGNHRVSAVHILERFKRLLKRLGLKGKLHTLRHFFISHCANNGVPPFQLIKWIGHTSLSTVMQYYSLQDEESIQTMQRLSLVGNGSRDGDESAEK
jgi:site-specific recombinase XerD